LPGSVFQHLSARNPIPLFLLVLGKSPLTPAVRPLFPKDIIMQTRVTRLSIETTALNLPQQRQAVSFADCHCLHCKKLAMYRVNGICEECCGLTPRAADAASLSSAEITGDSSRRG
jgi:hypothetical protein